MAQNYNIGNLGQKLTVDLAGNVVSLSTTVNAAAHTVGSSFVANTSQLTISGIPLSANGSTGTATYVLTSNGATGSPYWAVGGGTFTGGTVSGATTFSANVTFNANVTLTTPLIANGSTGTATYVLTSNGATGSPYWSSVTVGSSYVQNTDSRTLSGNLNFTGTNVYFTAANFGSIGTGTGGVVANVTTLFIGNNTVNAYLTTTGLNINAVTIANTTGVYTGVVNGSTISDAIGPIRSIPVNNQTSAYQLASTDNGQVVSITTGGVTVNGAVLSTGHTSVIFNNSGSTQTITIGSGGTMYLSGNTTSANRTLAARGVCTLLMVAANTFIISGSLT